MEQTEAITTDSFQGLKSLGMANKTNLKKKNFMKLLWAYMSSLTHDFPFFFPDKVEL